MAGLIELKLDTATQALAALAAAAPHLEVLSGAGLRLEKGDWAGWVMRLPNPYQQGGAVETAFLGFKSALEQVGGDATEGDAPADAQLRAGLALSEGIAALLLNSSADAATDGDRARAQDHEMMVIAAGADADAAARLFDAFNAQAAGLRVASYTDEAGQGGGHAFHVLNDRRMGSTADGLIAAGLGKGVEVLHLMTRGGARVFVPPRQKMSALAVEAVQSLIAQAPTALGLSKRAATGDRPALALVQAKDGGPIDLITLDRLTFADKVALYPEESTGVVVRRQRLQPAVEGRKALKSAISDLGRRNGYELELRKARGADNPTREIERLREDILALEERQAFLMGLNQRRQVLLRFTSQQLPAMMDAVRCFPLADLGRGWVQHAFSASQQDPAGVHYLMYDPSETVMNAPWPLAGWEHALGGPPMRFMLDPWWASHYGQDGSRSLVFVPDGETLFPPLAAWETAGMDDWLREMLDQLFPDRAFAETLPKRPAYVFDRQEMHGNQHGLTLTVLDQSGFAPLIERLPFVNRQMMLFDRLKSGGMLDRLARASAMKELAEEVGAEADVAVSRFRERAEQINEAVADDSTKLELVLRNELAAAATRARDLVTELTRIHTDVDDFASLLRDAAKDVEILTTHYDRISALARSGESRRSQATADLKLAIKESEQTLARVEKDVLKPLERLKAARESLLKTANLTEDA
ncbi:MAG: hypothetical protein Alpg2KO_07080 [Alphaproteobacteria bacterium]